MKQKSFLLLGALGLLALIVFAPSCKPEPQPPDVKGDLEDIPYDPQPYELQIPQGFPPMDIPADNPMTVEGIELGRFLFYDSLLSLDYTVSCASCHLQAGGFTDNKAVSDGVMGLQGTRSAMAVMNLGFVTAGLFWDGRAATLEDQALQPVENPVEMANTWEVVEERLRQHPDYPAMFRKAFGISDSKEITRDLVVKAIAQFERTMITANSKFDRKFLYNDPTVEFTDSEYRGFEMFFDFPGSALPDAQCFHCHNAPLFGNNDFFNNGIEEVTTLNDFPDPGRGAITGKTFDNGKFRAPTLRNLVFTAPYMHDGRFETLEEVIDQYSDHVHFADNLDENLSFPLNLSESQKQDLLNFLYTLTDSSIILDERFSNPF